MAAGCPCSVWSRERNSPRSRPRPAALPTPAQGHHGRDFSTQNRERVLDVSKEAPSNGDWGLCPLACDPAESTRRQAALRASKPAGSTRSAVRSPSTAPQPRSSRRLGNGQARGPLTHRQGRPGLPRLHAGVAKRRSTRRLLPHHDHHHRGTGWDGDGTRPPALAVPRARTRAQPCCRPWPAVRRERVATAPVRGRRACARRAATPLPSASPFSQPAGREKVGVSHSGVSALREKTPVSSDEALISYYVMVICCGLVAVLLQKGRGRGPSCCPWPWGEAGPSWPWGAGGCSRGQRGSFYLRLGSARRAVIRPLREKKKKKKKAFLRGKHFWSH